MSGLQAPAPGVYRGHRPETTALYEVVRDNLETLYGAIGDGAIAVRIPKHARKELEAYLDDGLLCRGFARLWCEGCGESRLVAFSGKGRGFCPSCLGRRMNATAADLMGRVLPPPSGLRQWVLRFPFSGSRRLAQDGALLGRLTRQLVEPKRAFFEPGGMAGSAARRVGSDLASLQLWVGDCRLLKDLDQAKLPRSPLWVKQVCRQRAFDNLIANIDRNPGNLLVDPEWNLILIDHSRAFATDTMPFMKEMTCIDRAFYEKLKALDEETLTRELKPWVLRERTIPDLLKRRDKIVARFDELTRRKSEVEVFPF